MGNKTKTMIKLNFKSLGFLSNFPDKSIKILFGFIFFSLTCGGILLYDINKIWRKFMAFFLVISSFHVWWANKTKKEYSIISNIFINVSPLVFFIRMFNIKRRKYISMERDRYVASNSNDVMSKKIFSF